MANSLIESYMLVCYSRKHIMLLPSGGHRGCGTSTGSAWQHVQQLVA